MPHPGNVRTWLNPPTDTWPAREVRPEPARQRGRPDAPQRGARPSADPGSRGRARHSERDNEPTRPETNHSHNRQDAQRLHEAAVDWREYETAIRQHERLIGRPAPPPTITGRRGGPKLSPWFTEWLMCLPAGHITNVPGLSVNDQLRLCGNGVIPLQAAAAYHWLLPQLLNTPPLSEREKGDAA